MEEKLGKPFVPPNTEPLRESCQSTAKSVLDNFIKIQQTKPLPEPPKPNVIAIPQKEQSKK